MLGRYYSHTNFWDDSPIVLKLPLIVTFSLMSKQVVCSRKARRAKFAANSIAKEPLFFVHSMLVSVKILARWKAFSAARH